MNDDQLTTPHAQVVLDSVSPEGARLTTLVVVMHRFVLAEFNTHRQFSRNSASSRAIPVNRQLERVATDCAYPLAWPMEQPGMQGGEAVAAVVETEARKAWREASIDAVGAAQRLRDLGVHKSVTNRLLEPFMWHTVIVSSTEWANFLGQRCSPLAQPEIRVAAEAMRAALDGSTPRRLAWGEWHTPLLHPDDRAMSVPETVAVSVARCARVSYLTHDGERSIEADVELFRRLVSAEPPHASPLEHVAQPSGLPPMRSGGSAPRTCDGNFAGWCQLRHHPALAAIREFLHA